MNCQQSFNIQTQQYLLHTTYQPAHISFTIKDKKTNQINGRIFYDSTLPDNVKDQCQEVADLYNFLSNKSPQELQIEKNCLKFRVVHIKKERWYVLDLLDQFGNRQQMEEQFAQREKILAQNQELKRSLRNMQIQNQELMSKLSCHINNPPSFINNIEHKTQPQPHVQLQILLTQGREHYQVQGNIITKLTDQSSILFFQPFYQNRRNKQKIISFSIHLLNDLAKNWIVFGFAGEEHLNKNYCYFQKNCIAFSGSMSLVFNDLETIDLGVVIRKGDQIELRMNRQLQSIEWFLNHTSICSHTIQGFKSGLSMYPFLMLARTNDQIIISASNQ